MQVAGSSQGAPTNTRVGGEVVGWEVVGGGWVGGRICWSWWLLVKGVVKGGRAKYKFASSDLPVHVFQFSISMFLGVFRFSVLGAFLVFHFDVFRFGGVFIITAAPEAPRSFPEALALG